ncbi:MAG: hypothetical protein J3R72DRAFT_421256 [Linnemannia gamsii]|nr:MAG: hypothetical protein J3R72DRAFT_421256 [Linnemannia gamsii]
MRPSFCSFTLVTSMLLLLNPPTSRADPLHWPNMTKRDNTVYVTVTEYRYVSQAQPSAASLAPNPPPQPVGMHAPFQVPSASLAPNPQHPPRPNSVAPLAELRAPSNVLPNTILSAPMAPPTPRPHPNPVLAVSMVPIESVAPPPVVLSAFLPLTFRPNLNPAPAAPVVLPHSAAPIAPAPIAPAASPIRATPALVVPANFVHSSALIASPINNPPERVVAAWTPPTNDALTYTSFAGLLTTMAPAFYPEPLNSAVPSLAIASPMPQQQSPPTPPSSTNHAPTSLTAPTSNIAPTLNTPVPLTHTSVPTPSASTNAKESTTAHSSALTTAHSDLTSSVDSASVSNFDTTTTSTSTSTSTSISTTTDVTVSTTTTTHGDTTSTKTTVGTDGTTTALTEYPTSTRSRGSQSTSGVQARWPRMQGRQDPSVGSVFAYLTGLLVSEARWSMIATAMIAALALPGAVALLV